MLIAAALRGSYPAIMIRHLIVSVLPVFAVFVGGCQGHKAIPTAKGAEIRKVDLMPVGAGDAKMDSQFVREIDPKMDRGMVFPRQGSSAKE